MLGFKRFRRPKITIAGIELLHRIRKNQFDLSKLSIQTENAPEMWEAVLAAEIQSRHNPASAQSNICTRATSGMAGVARRVRVDRMASTPNP